MEGCGKMVCIVKVTLGGKEIKVKAIEYSYPEINLTNDNQLASALENNKPSFHSLVGRS